MTKEQRKEQIDELLREIAGVEESIRMAIDDKDWDFMKQLKKMKKNKYEKLWKAIYGLKT